MRSFKYMGKYQNEESLPVREHPEGYVPFKEPESMKKLAILANLLALVITALTGYLFVARILRCGNVDKDSVAVQFMIGTWASMLLLIPHEFLHGLAMKGDVQMYQNLKQGLLFVVSTDDMSKGQFIFMSMLPNLAFGFVPFIVFLIFPQFVVLGALGALSIGAGAGDYINVYNAATQVPNGAKVYMSGMHSYWHP